MKKNIRKMMAAVLSVSILSSVTMINDTVFADDHAQINVNIAVEPKYDNILLQEEGDGIIAVSNSEGCNVRGIKLNNNSVINLISKDGTIKQIKNQSGQYKQLYTYGTCNARTIDGWLDNKAGYIEKTNETCTYTYDSWIGLLGDDNYTTVINENNEYFNGVEKYHNLQDVSTSALINEGKITFANGKTVDVSAVKPLNTEGKRFNKILSEGVDNYVVASLEGYAGDFVFDKNGNLIYDENKMYLNGDIWKMDTLTGVIGNNAYFCIQNPVMLNSIFVLSDEDKYDISNNVLNFENTNKLMFMLNTETGTFVGCENVVNADMDVSWGGIYKSNLYAEEYSYYEGQYALESKKVNPGIYDKNGKKLIDFNTVFQVLTKDMQYATIQKTFYTVGEDVVLKFKTDSYDEYGNVSQEIMKSYLLQAKDNYETPILVDDGMYEHIYAGGENMLIRVTYNGKFDIIDKNGEQIYSSGDSIYGSSVISEDGTLHIAYRTKTNGGTYKWGVLSASENKVVVGDLDGDGTINSTDAVAIQKYLAGNVIEGFTKESADLNGDGEVNSADSVLLMKYLAGYEVKFEN